MSDKGKTRQCKMYQARVAQGLCAQCGSLPLVTAVHCQPCREKHNARMRNGYRARNNSGTWYPGGRGRPPLAELARREKCKQNWIDIGSNGRRKVIGAGLSAIAAGAIDIFSENSMEALGLEWGRPPLKREDK